MQLQPLPKPSGRERPRIELVRSGGVSLPADNAESPRIPPRVGDSSARPDLKAQLEPFHLIARELPPLFERHWREIALHQDKIALEPDWARYYDLEGSGALHVMTARCGGALVGYIFNLVAPHLHYRSTLHAEMEMFWLDPVYRGGTFPVRWFRANEDALRQMGVKRISGAVKNHFMSGRVGSLFKRIGYAPIETVYSKVL